MWIRRLPALGLITALGLGAAACTEDGYGYSGVSVGYSSGGYYDDHGPGYGYDPSSYFGWYGDYYYPGTGYYVYDRDRRPYRWNDGQRRYWYDRGRQYRGDRRENWGDFGNWRDNRRDWRDRDRDGRRDRPDRRYRR